jgi:hypothetical protein
LIGIGSWAGPILSARQAVDKAIADTAVMRATVNIKSMETNATDVLQRIGFLSSQIESQSGEFNTRLQDLKKNDNVVLYNSDGSLHLNTSLVFDKHASIILRDGGVILSGGGQCQMVFSTTNVFFLLPNGNPFMICN